MIIKTHDEIRALKKNWLDDPCWDIETTEGFEMYTDELLEFRQMWEGRWTQEHIDNVNAQAATWGCSPQTADMLMKLTSRVAELELQIEYMTGEL